MRLVQRLRTNEGSTQPRGQSHGLGRYFRLGSLLGCFERRPVGLYFVQGAVVLDVLLAIRLLVSNEIPEWLGGSAVSVGSFVPW